MWIPLSLIAAHDAEKKFRELCDSLPKEGADKLRQERRDKREKEIEHNKKLEIAEAGRARNFWGN